MRNLVVVRPVPVDELDLLQELHPARDLHREPRGDDLGEGRVVPVGLAVVTQEVQQAPVLGVLDDNLHVVQRHRLVVHVAPEPKHVLVPAADLRMRMREEKERTHRPRGTDGSALAPS